MVLFEARLEWVAVPHFNTEHPHVHVAMRGFKDDGSPLGLNLGYHPQQDTSHSPKISARAKFVHRNQVDAFLTAERREIHERRYPSLPDDQASGRTRPGTSMGSVNPATSLLAGA